MFSRSIPSPSSSYFELGPLTLHFYALCIIAGIAVAIWLGDKRLRAINPELKSVVADIALRPLIISDQVVPPSISLLSGKVGLEFGALFRWEH
jgi:hypothetical protein